MNTRYAEFTNEGFPSRMLPMFDLLAILMLLSAGVAQQSIRNVDFRNFTFPLSGPTLGHNRLTWLDPSRASHVRLINSSGAPQSPGFTLKSVQFADVTSRGKEDAIVTLHFDTGGTQQTDYVYLYSFSNSVPTLLGYFHTGDRAYSGLYRVYGQDGKLVVELFDPQRRTGDCCSTGLVRTRYKWNNERFKIFGAREFATVPEQ